MIRTNGLTKIFTIKKGADIQAVVSLDLSINQGEVFGFLGPNGAGKTTTVRMLTSLIGPTSGEAWINGFKVGVDDQAIRRSVGVLTEHPGMYERLSAFKNLSIYANLYDVENPDQQVMTFTAPEVDIAKTMHFILEVKDNGSPSLIRYERVIVNVIPSTQF